MTKPTKKQESLLNELLADFMGDTEAIMGQNCRETWSEPLEMEQCLP